MCCGVEGTRAAAAVNVSDPQAKGIEALSCFARPSRNGGWRGMAEFYFYPYIDLGFAQIEEVSEALPTLFLAKSYPISQYAMQ